MDESLLNEPWQKYDCVFDEMFWHSVIERLWQRADGEASLLHQQFFIVPDASMYVPFQQAWQAHTRTHNIVCVTPRLMTLLDWAKSQGAADLDGQNTERTIDWMAQLSNVPELTKWLSGSDESDIFSIAQSIVALSDELSLFFLPGQKIDVGEQSLQRAVSAIYDAQSGILAQQELAALLQFWRASVQQQMPIVRYLSVLAKMCQQPSIEVTVLRNRAWSAHEAWFWRELSGSSNVTLLNIQQTRSCHSTQFIKKAWGTAAEHILEPYDKNELNIQSHRIYAAHHLEDEAVLIMQQVLLWRDQGLKKIALVALDRTVSRRVWALLGRCGVVIRDDTGWLLSTSRCASSWQYGFQLWAGDVTVTLLLDWLSHPFVMGNIDEGYKEFLLRYLKELSYKSQYVLRTWRGWLYFAQKNEPSQLLQDDSYLMKYEWVLQILQKSVAYERQFLGTKTLPQWVEVVLAWGREFGMADSWKLDAAGQVWLQLLESWRGIASTTALSFSEFLRVVQSDVEQAAFRAQDVSDEVLLLPLGSTRMRDFDAVWLMGADARNLPSMSPDMGLLNVAARLKLGMPTFMDAQTQALRDVIDLWARTPILIASFCLKKDGSPNALSAWLTQWLRAAGKDFEVINLSTNQLIPDVAYRQQITVSNCLPKSLSATDLASLVKCPYQFYTRKILGLKVSETKNYEVTPSEKGNLWHGLVVDFHDRRALSEINNRETDVTIFNLCINQLLNPLALQNARYWVTREQFLSYVDAYIDWWRARELSGWQVASNEVWYEQTRSIQVDGSQNIPLRWQGKIDQIDVRDCFDEVSNQHIKEFALIDYKTGSLAQYQKEIAKESDVQLAFYLNLLQSNMANHVIQAGYIGVSDKPIKSRKGNTEKPHQGDNYYPQAWLNQSIYSHSAEELKQAAQNLQQQVNNHFKDMAQAAPLKALGELAACQYCNARGLCRKGYVLNKDEKKEFYESN